MVALVGLERGGNFEYEERYIGSVVNVHGVGIQLLGQLFYELDKTNGNDK